MYLSLARSFPHLGSLSFKSAGTVDDPSARSSPEEMWHTPISLSPPMTTPCTRRSAPFWKHLDTKLTSNNLSSGLAGGSKTTCATAHTAPENGVTAIGGGAGVTVWGDLPRCPPTPTPPREVQAQTPVAA